MEFIIDKNALQKEISLLRGTVERRATMPALGNLLFEAHGDECVRVTATDLDTTITCETGAEVGVAGALCVQAHKMIEITGLLTDGPVHFQAEAQGWTRIRAGNSTFRVAGVTRDQFPQTPPARASSYRLPAALVRSFVENTLFAATREESRYALAGAKFVLDAQGARMVTTDGHRMALDERRGVVALPAGAPGVDVLIPQKTLAELAKLIAGHDGEIGFVAGENHIYFEAGRRSLISRTLAGQFPDYELVLPKGNDLVVRLPTVETSRALRRVALMADKSRAVRLAFSKNALLIQSETAEEGTAEEWVRAEYDGAPLEIRFNAQYLQDFLDRAGSETIVAELKDASAQAMLRPEVEPGADGYRYVIMPLRP